MEDCVFCKIVGGKIPCSKIWEDENFLAFLDVNPSVKGQVLVIPKKHIGGYVFQLNAEVYSKFLLVARKIALALDKSLNPIKTGMIVEGLEVDHVHIKLYPLFEGFTLSPKGEKISSEEIETLVRKIKSNL